MNINEMTIGQAKELASLFGGVKQQNSGGIFSDAIGKYVIVRSRNEGVNAGFVEMADETGIVLKEARRLWWHKPASSKESWYEGVANHGLSDDSKVSGVVAKKVIVEDYSIVYTTDKAQKSIQGAFSHAQG